MIAYTMKAPGTYRILHTLEDFYEVQYCYWNGWSSVANKREGTSESVYKWETPELAAAYLVGLTNNHKVPLKMHEAMLLIAVEEKQVNKEQEIRQAREAYLNYIGSKEKSEALYAEYKRLSEEKQEA